MGLRTAALLANSEILICIDGDALLVRDLRRLLTTDDKVLQVDFLETHPLIRPLTAYSLDRLCPA